MKRFIVIALLLASSTLVAQYNNGPFVTNPGAAAGCILPVPSGDGCALDTTSAALGGPALTTFGYTANATIRLADDFVVPAGQTWTLSDITVYGYQTLTGNSTVSTFTAGNYRIWCGQPGAGGVIVADFSAANQMTSTAWTGAFRSTLLLMPALCTAANQTRKIMAITMTGNAIVLSPGTYWLDFGAQGSTASTFFPPISILGTPGTGNALQQNGVAGAYLPITSGSLNAFTQGVPFQINYAVAGAPSPIWETNSAEASVDFNGAQANPCNLAGGAAISTTCVGNNVTATIASTHVGFGWELALSLLPAKALGAGGLAVTATQTLNVDVLGGDPTLTYLNGLTFPGFAFPLGAGSPVVLNFPAPALPTGSAITAQMIVLSPTNPDGFALSAAAQLSTTTGPGIIFPLAGPATDESAVFLNLNASPVCASLGMPYFGTTRSNMAIVSNGFVSFDQFVFADLSPTALENSWRQVVGAHHDLNPAAVGSGNITITNPGPGLISVNYNGVFRFGSVVATNAATYSILFDTVTGNISIDSLGGVLPTPAAMAMWIGISAGVTGSAPAPLGASTPLAINPTLGAAPVGGQFYQFTTGVPIATPACSTLLFTPDGLNGYLVSGS